MKITENRPDSPFREGVWLPNCALLLMTPNNAHPLHTIMVCADVSAPPPVPGRACPPEMAVVGGLVSVLSCMPRTLASEAAVSRDWEALPMGTS